MRRPNNRNSPLALHAVMWCTSCGTVLPLFEFSQLPAWYTLYHPWLKMESIGPDTLPQDCTKQFYIIHVQCTWVCIFCISLAHQTPSTHQWGEKSLPSPPGGRGLAREINSVWTCVEAFNPDITYSIVENITIPCLHVYFTHNMAVYSWKQCFLDAAKNLFWYSCPLKERRVWWHSNTLVCTGVKGMNGSPRWMTPMGVERPLQVANYNTLTAVGTARLL